MKQSDRSSTSLPRGLKNLLKENSAKKNLFMWQYIESLVTQDLQRTAQGK